MLVVQVLLRQPRLRHPPQLRPPPSRTVVAVVHRLSRMPATAVVAAAVPVVQAQDAAAVRVPDAVAVAVVPAVAAGNHRRSLPQRAARRRRPRL